MWTIPLTWNSLKAVVVNPAKRAELEQTDRTLEEWVVQESTIGGRIFAKLVEERKAIVGFQLLSDMLFLIDTFYGELPKSYTGFKALIGDLFPNMYDGKTITQMLSRHERINTFGHFDSPSLLELYSTLTTPRTSGMFAHAPLFQLDIRHTHYGCETHAHEAAFDAFMSGVVFVHAIFALSADKLAEARALAAHTTTHPFDLTRESNQGGSAPPPAGNARRVMRDGSSTCHALPPLVLRQVPQDIETVLAYRGLLYIHMCADKCLNIFGDDEQANRSKAWVRLFSTDGEVPVAESPLVKAFLAALAYEHYVKSPMEIVIACTTSDRAAKVAEYARRGLSVPEIFDSAVSKRLISQCPLLITEQ
ncbi:hypothetical protein BV898_07941 [Hypsibius exemplaris]|uniref:Uncharacterized protein n=1 Tax=Hypsibius exemplaris TaxID=2072580 RepID=A0A1W0WS20_HYPEX|nr:hypothetical protein BV898_07941 [Hypsibius exemplaris]